MTQKTDKTTVKGGWISRNSANGKFVAVGTDAGVVKKSPKSATTVKEVSDRRNAALKRLVNR